MDKQVVSRLDSIAEDEIGRGFRIRDLPERLQKMMKSAGFPPIARVRFSALNPARRRFINEVTQQRYFKDLQNEGIPSDDQVLEWAEKRKRWSRDRQQRMELLQSKVAREMSALWNQGLTPDSVTWSDDIVRLARIYKDAVNAYEALGEDEKLETYKRFDRWVMWTPDADMSAFAADQGLEKYSVDRDFQWLLDHVPSVNEVDLLNEIDDLRDKQYRLVKLSLERYELAELQVTHARLFSGTAESRQAHTEELATVYFSTEIVNAEDVPQGRVAASFDEMWNFPHDVITWLVWEANFFHNDIPDEARNYLTSFGFLKADRPKSESTQEKSASGASAPSGASPEAPSSKTDSAPSIATPSTTSESTATS